MPIFPCLSAPRNHTKHRFDVAFFLLGTIHKEIIGNVYILLSLLFKFPCYGANADIKEVFG